MVAELKAVTELLSDHEAQLFNYMRIAQQPVGYLINFGHKGDLEWRRFILSDLHRPASEHELKQGFPDANSETGDQC